MGSATPLTIWSSFRWWGGCAGGSTSCPGFPQTKSSILGRAQFVGVALFLIARGVLVHEFVVSAHPAGLQRSYEHPMVCMIHGRPCTPLYARCIVLSRAHTHTLSLSLSGLAKPSDVIYKKVARQAKWLIFKFCKLPT